MPSATEPSAAACSKQYLTLATPPRLMASGQRPLLWHQVLGYGATGRQQGLPTRGSLQPYRSKLTSLWCKMYGHRNPTELEPSALKAVTCCPCRHKHEGAIQYEQIMQPLRRWHSANTNVARVSSVLPPKAPCLVGGTEPVKSDGIGSPWLLWDSSTG